MNYKSLTEKAREAKSRALPTYSNFKVGAALVTEDDKIYTGCNIERTSIFKAISEGERKFKAIAVAGDTEGFISPCGACRQVISDLCGDIDVVLVNSKNETKVMKTSELLPFAFSDKDLK
jgi:cytidine deaminase